MTKLARGHTEMTEGQDQRLACLPPEPVCPNLHHTVSCVFGLRASEPHKDWPEAFEITLLLHLTPSAVHKVAGPRGSSLNWISMSPKYAYILGICPREVTELAYT